MNERLMKQFHRTTYSENLVKIVPVDFEMTCLESRPLKINDEKPQAKHTARPARMPGWISDIRDFSSSAIALGITQTSNVVRYRPTLYPNVAESPSIEIERNFV